MSSDIRLWEAQKGVVRLRVDVTKDNRTTVRHAIGAPHRGAPYIAFFDGAGRLRPELSVLGFDAAKALASLQRLQDG